MKHPILYSFRRCPYAMRARMAIYLADIECELREVYLKNKPTEMLEISPKGTVPVLQLNDGTVLDESLDIMNWVIDKNDKCNLIDIRDIRELEKEMLEAAEKLEFEKAALLRDQVNELKNLTGDSSEEKNKPSGVSYLPKKKTKRKR